MTAGKKTVAYAAVEKSVKRENSQKTRKSAEKEKKFEKDIKVEPKASKDKD